MTGGSPLRWGLLDSFVSYVETFGGVVTTVAPAERGLDGRFAFPRERVDSGVEYFAGEVWLSAHAGLLSVTLAELRLDPLDVGAGRTLSIRGSSATTGSDGGRLPVAVVSESGSVSLLESGRVLFDFRYPAGHELAPIEIGEDEGDV